MSFERIAEEKIRNAIERGEFDNLPGAGSPLTGLDDYFSTPEHLRLGYSVLRSAHMLPREVQLLREIADLKVQLVNLTELHGRERLASRIQTLQLQYDILMDQYRRPRRQGA
jgi:hypothetical protein